MIVLVANLGSTSFKYKLFDMDTGRSDEATATTSGRQSDEGMGRHEGSAGERVLAEGSADRIGQGQSAWRVQCDDRRSEGTADLPDHGAAIELHLGKLTELGAIDGIDRVEAIGFKAVHGGPIGGPVNTSLFAGD